MKRGFAAIESESYDDAVKIGRELIRLCHSSGFEIAGLSYQRQGKVSAAIRILEKGTTKAPSVWVLWKLLGDCYSDATKFDQAEAAYQTALSKEGADDDLINLNRGIAFHRAKRWAQAEKALKRVTSPRLGAMAQATLIDVAISRGDKKRAARLATRLANSKPLKLDPKLDDPDGASYILSACALGLSQKQACRLRARRHAIKAVFLGRDNFVALRIIRELDAQKTAQSCGYRLLLAGVWDEPFDEGKAPTQFFRTCEVIAQDVPSALRYCKVFFPRGVRASLRVEESSHWKVRRDDLEGVYRLSGYFFYETKE